MDEQESHLIYAFPRAQGEEIQIALRKYHGRVYIDLRVWYQAKNESQFRPTKKGLFFSVEHAQELKKGIERLAKATDQYQSKQEMNV